jgi:hypothetical protein
LLVVGLVVIGPVLEPDSLKTYFFWFLQVSVKLVQWKCSNSMEALILLT